jgi:hypothetical protein
MRVSVWHDGSMIGRDLTRVPRVIATPLALTALDCFAALGRVGEVAFVLRADVPGRTVARPRREPAIDHFVMAITSPGHRLA